MGTHPIFESDFDCLTEMNRLRGIVRTLPRIKLEHIQPDVNLKYERSMRITPEQAKMQKKNKPIYLWDGSPLHTSMKPSIGAEHFFRKGFFWGSDGKKKNILIKEDDMEHKTWHITKGCY